MCPSRNRSITTPTHASLFETYNRCFSGNDFVAIDVVIDTLSDKWKEFTPHDFVFSLEMIQDLSTSQQEFWESMATLIRYSFSHMNHMYAQSSQEWRRTIAYAMMEVFWKQDLSAFADQIERARERPAAAQELDCWGPFSSDAEILAHITIDSLLLTYCQKRALELFEILSERGISMPGRFLESFIRVAVANGDGYQLERIGGMLLRQEELYHRSSLLTSEDTRPRNRPLTMPSRLMDVFVQGACDNGLFELAREVFDRGLEANRKYRAITFTRILNSYSVKEFGFDVVDAANSIKKRAKVDRLPKRRKDVDDSGALVMPSRPVDDDAASVQRPPAKAITVADPKDIEKYISVMETLGIEPSIVTLNVLTKLYLEMAQYKVPDAPVWKSAFKRYNPLGLEPDVVTHNTLLAYYEKHRDLTTMRKIYDDMVGVPGGGWVNKSKRARRLQRKQAEQGRVNSHETSDLKKTGELTFGNDTAAQDHDLSQSRYSSENKPSSPRHIRSNRDIYTYNTMLHALLQHAVETKDIASIGQCFYDMEQDGISADTVTFNTNILYHISRGDYAAAMQVYHSMDGTAHVAKRMTAVSSDSWASSSAATTGILAGLGPAGSSSSKPIRSTPSFVTSMPQYKLKGADGDKRVYNVDEGSQAPSSPKPAKGPAAVAATSQDSPPEPDVVTFTSLISGFGQSNKMDKAISVFMEMTKRFKIEPNLKTYSALAAGLHRAGDHERAERLWDEVLVDEEKSNERKEMHWNSSDNEGQASETNSGGRQEEEIELSEEERAERLYQERLIGGDMGGHLTVLERRQVEARRRMYRDSLKE
ncbi:hypothetical protein BGZ80_004414 [Entomortierella chlamydospora]|uniref:Pentatricopeptide repeat protein n=1 Tax=Entomortierella chlamydospora TaxID=101097 RepID=A0A9P6MMC9_9FUNG|nr:hypothetical protein BGZ80_004414 [Entomortierella chlamydospora]